MACELPEEIVRYVLGRCAEPALRDRLVDTLVRILRIDTTPSADVGRMAAHEQAVFDILVEEVRSCGLPGVEVSYRAIDPRIAEHPYYTPVHYTKTSDRPQGLSAAEAYAGRHNLVVTLGGRNGAGAGLAMNSHIDVVAPYLPPRVEGGFVYGRGSADAKGCVMVMIGAMRLLAELRERFGVELPRDLVCMIVIDEEPGGNGSLSLALDTSLKRRYEAMLVLEITGLKLHPANRGALWYRCELDGRARPDVNLLEASAFVTLALEDEGARIKAESEHPLFPDRPVQTCHGILGPFGKHPSAVNDHVEFDLLFEQPVDAGLKRAVVGVLERGLAAYIERYGDKSRESDPETGQPKVPVHYQVNVQDRTLRVVVHGKAGHMGAILECDCGITKAAYLVRELVRARRGDSAGVGAFRLALADQADPGHLVQEGGQGFVPTHTLAEVGRRLQEAARRGVAEYGVATGRAVAPERLLRMTYEKLHNDAFDGDPDSPIMRTAVHVQKLMGLWQEEPILGWKVSCDARLFAKQYPGLPVVTFGPGLLKDAHSLGERIRVDDLMKAVGFATLLAVAYGGHGGRT